MSLEINRIAFKFVCAAAEEMVEANLKKSGGRSECRDVSADAVLHAVGANNHRQRVPANQALDSAFHFLIAGKVGLVSGGNRVYIGGVGGEGEIHAGGNGAVTNPFDDSAGERRTAAFEDGIERLKPFPYLFQMIELRSVLRCVGYYLIFDLRSRTVIHVISPLAGALNYDQPNKL